MTAITSIDSREDVRTWLAQLDADGLLFHLEDSVDSVVWDVPVTDEQRASMEALRQQVWTVATRDGFDPFDLYPDGVVPA